MTTAPDWGSQTSADVFATALIGQMHTDEPSLGLEGYHHDFGDSEALRSGLLRLWQHYEDQITTFLAKKAESQPTPTMRLCAMQHVAIVRSITLLELRGAVTDLGPKEAIAVIEQWLRTAAQNIGPYRAGV